MIAKHIDAWLVLGALALAAGLWSARGTPGVVDADITLITADKADLSCALELAVGAHRCRYRTPQQPVPEAGAKWLQPFVTVNGVRYLIDDLFAQPALAQRHARELPDGRPRDAYRRFTAHCRLELLRWVEGAQVQFGPSASWVAVPPLWVAVPVFCSVVEP